MSRQVTELQVLGPLEARIGGEPVSLGGAKQRAVLAVLLLREGEVVSVDRLIEEVWGNDPPPSAAHTLESYVSRLRQLFNGHGPRLVRRGAGYALELVDAELDARVFVDLHEQAGHAAAEEDHERVVRLAAAALAVWRGPALADVALASAGRAEAERLEELRLRTHELDFDALLALGRHEQAVGALQALVGQNPYRERFVAQLMLALYRSGRHADALTVYQRLRISLDEDLGLQPSAELQQLSGQIVRQEPGLRRPAHSTPVVVRHRRMDRGARRASALVIAGAVATAAMTLTASGGAAVPDGAPPAPNRVALVLPGSADALDVAAQGVSTGLKSAALVHALETRTLYIEEEDAGPDANGVIRQIRKEGVGLVVVLGDGPAARALSRSVRSLPETRFVFVDASLRELSLERVPNAAAMRFADEDTTYLAGYMSGLMPTRDGARARVDAVSVVAGKPTRDTRRLIAGYTRGLRAVRRDVEIRVEYSRELEDPTACERLANRQIDMGSDVVVAVAGRCGLGALAVAGFRGVWGVGAEEDGVGTGPHVLMRTHKEWEQAVTHAVGRHIAGTLPTGRDVVLGLEDDYAAGLFFSYEVPERVASVVIHRCSQIRAVKKRDI